MNSLFYICFSHAHSISRLWIHLHTLIQYIWNISWIHLPPGKSYACSKGEEVATEQLVDEWSEYPTLLFFPAESWIIYNMPSGYFALSFSWQRKQQSNRCVSRSEQPGEGVRRAMGEGRGRGRIREQWERWVVEVGVGDRREGGSGRGMWGGRGRKRGKWAGRRRGGEGIGKW